MLFDSFFNNGWVSHGVKSDIFKNKGDRLNYFRNSFIYSANFLVLGLSLIFFKAIEQNFKIFDYLRKNKKVHLSYNFF